MKKFFIEDDLIQNLGWLGIDYKKAMKKRILQTLLIFVAMIFLGYTINNNYLMLIAMPVSLVYYKFLYIQIKNNRKAQILLKRRMFPSFVKKLLILLRTNNIYMSLKIMVDFTDEPYKTFLLELIKDINEDKSRKPYVDFANKLEFSEANQIMLMVYTFTNITKSDKHLISLDNLISKLNDNELEEAMETKKRTLWLFPNYTILTMLALIFSLAIYMFIDILSGVSF